MNPPDPKPIKRVVDRSARPAGDRCVATGQTYILHAHHLVPRGGGGGKAGGDDVTENLVWLESGVHDRFHHGSPAQRAEAGHLIRKGLGLEHIGYIVAHPRGGWEFLENKYPAEPW